MLTERTDGGSFFMRAVRDTLDSVVPPRVRDSLVHDALALGGFAALPKDRAAMAAFTTGPLRAVAEEVLGTALAESIAEEILRCVARATSKPTGRNSKPTGTRSRPPPSRGQEARETSRPPARASRNSARPAAATGRKSARPPSVPPAARKSAQAAPLLQSQERHLVHRSVTPAPLSARRGPAPGRGGSASWPAGPSSTIRPNRGVRNTEPANSEVAAEADIPLAPLILVATEEELLYETLHEWFDHRAIVDRVTNPMDLVRSIDASGGRRVVIVLDGKRPAIRPPALAALVEDMPRIEVVMCRTAPALEEVILSTLPASAKWVIYREPASLDHVAAECLRLVS